MKKTLIFRFQIDDLEKIHKLLSYLVDSQKALKKKLEKEHLKNLVSIPSWPLWHFLAPNFHVIKAQVLLKCHILCSYDKSPKILQFLLLPRLKNDRRLGLKIVHFFKK